MNIGRLALENIEKFGEFSSTHFEGRAYSNVESDLYAGRMAAVLKERGVRAGENVILMMPNSPDVPAAFQACWKIGAVISPITPMLGPREVRFLIENSEAPVVITSPVLAARVKQAGEGIPTFKHLLVIGPTDVEGAIDISRDIAMADPISGLADRSDDDLSMLLYTSGTTGNPKGVMLTHGNLLSNAYSVAKLTDVPPRMRAMHVLPLSHSFGVLMMNLGYVLGFETSLLTHFDTKKVFETIQDFKVERFSVVPTMLTYMINFPEKEKYDTSSLVRVNTGGAALLNELRVAFERVFNCIVKEGYGLSETSPTLTGYDDHVAYRAGSVGRAIEGVQVCVLDMDNKPVEARKLGEICARGPNIMRGYWKLEEVSKEAMAGGWFHSGDIGYMDEDGFVYITDRKKDLIIKGGENISPREIEEVIQEHPAVAEAAVVGVPDPVFGENITATIVLKPDTQVTEEEMKEHIGKFVTKFKIPAQIVFMSYLPKNPTGKIQKREIKDQLRAKMQPAAAK